MTLERKLKNLFDAILGEAKENLPFRKRLSAALMVEATSAPSTDRPLKGALERRRIWRAPSALDRISEVRLGQSIYWRYSRRLISSSYEMSLPNIEWTPINWS